MNKHCVPSTLTKGDTHTKVISAAIWTEDGNPYFLPNVIFSRTHLRTL